MCHHHAALLLCCCSLMLAVLLVVLVKSSCVYKTTPPPVSIFARSSGASTSTHAHMHTYTHLKQVDRIYHIIGMLVRRVELTVTQRFENFLVLLENFFRRFPYLRRVREQGII